MRRIIFPLLGAVSVAVVLIISRQVSKESIAESEPLLRSSSSVETSTTPADTDQVTDTAVTSTEATHLTVNQPGSVVSATGAKYLRFEGSDPRQDITEQRSTFQRVVDGVNYKVREFTDQAIKLLAEGNEGLSR